MSQLTILRASPIETRGDFLRWLCKVAENRFHDTYDKFHADQRYIHKEIPLREEARGTESGFVGVAGPVRNTTPSVIVSRKESLDRLEAALDELKPKYKEIIVLKKIEGLSYVEIGQRLGKGPDAVGMLLSRATAALTIAYRKD